MNKLDTNQEKVKLGDLKVEKSQEEIVEIKNKRKKEKLVVIVFLFVLFCVYYLVPGVKSKVNEAFITIPKLDTKVVITYLRSYGKIAVVVSFVRM